MIKKCSTYLNFRNRKSSERIINHPIPDQTWIKIAQDLFRLYGRYYLLMIDQYSKFGAIDMLKDSQSSNVINKCKKLFSEFGTQKTIAKTKKETILTLKSLDLTIKF